MNQGSPEASSNGLTVIRRRLFSGLALIILPAALMLVVVAAKYEGLRNFTAMDHAQVARNLAAGEGMTTSVIRPLSVAFKADLRHHPDLYNPPVHILVIAAFFKLFGPTARVAVVSGAALWIVAVWLTFVVGWKWFGWQAGLVAALFFGCNVTGVASTVGALPYPLYAIVTLLAIWAAFSKRVETVPAEIRTPDEADQAPQMEILRDDKSWLNAVAPQVSEIQEQNDEPPVLEPVHSPWRIGLSGAVCALAILTHFPLGAVAVAIGWCIVAAQPRKWHALGVFALGFFAAFSPWLLRAWMAAGSPFINLYSFEALAGTGQFPGESIWRYAIPPDQPSLFVFHHPVQAGLKLLDGLNIYRRESVDVIDPVVILPFLVALFDRSFSAMWKWPLRATTAGLLLTSVVGSLLRPDSAVLLAWSPAMSIIAAGWLSKWFPEFVRKAGDSASRNARENDRLSARARTEWWVQAAAYTGLLFVVGLPLMQYIFVARPAGDPHIAEHVAMLTRKTPAGASVLTDEPAMVAWYCNRLAVWLPQREQDLATLEQTFGSFDASYVTIAVAQMPSIQKGDWWYWVTVPTGVFHGLAPVEPPPANAALRVRSEISSK